MGDMSGFARMSAMPASVPSQVAFMHADDQRRAGGKGTGDGDGKYAIHDDLDGQEFRMPAVGEGGPTLLTIEGMRNIGARFGIGEEMKQFGVIDETIPEIYFLLGNFREGEKVRVKVLGGGDGTEELEPRVVRTRLGELMEKAAKDEELSVDEKKALAELMGKSGRILMHGLEGPNPAITVAIPDRDLGGDDDAAKAAAVRGFAKGHNKTPIHVATAAHRSFVFAQESYAKIDGCGTQVSAFEELRKAAGVKMFDLKFPGRIIRVMTKREFIKAQAAEAAKPGGGKILQGVMPFYGNYKNAEYSPNMDGKYRARYAACYVDQNTKELVRNRARRMIDAIELYQMIGRDPDVPGLGIV
ncbi:MAG: hypothetical protein LBB38_03405 [Puniceicoccales bacterium]|nr:hypothetical protein [Puniceicoccales bacterium]